MTRQRTAPLRIAALTAIVTPALVVQALASGPNEYTLSPSETSTAVTSYQNTYQPQAIQPQTAQPATPQFGEILFDTQPYMPDANNGTVQTYTGEAALQPYQAAPLQPLQPTYMPSATN